jgi:hypothetical protein
MTPACEMSASDLCEDTAETREKSRSKDRMAQNNERAEFYRKVSCQEARRGATVRGIDLVRARLLSIPAAGRLRGRTHRVDLAC